MTNEILNDIANYIAENVKVYVTENINDGNFSGIIGGEYYLRRMCGLIPNSVRDEYSIMTQEDALAVRGKVAAEDLVALVYTKIKDLGFHKIDISTERQERFYPSSNETGDEVIYKSTGKYFYICHLALEW